MLPFYFHDLGSPLLSLIWILLLGILLISCSFIRSSWFILASPQWCIFLSCDFFSLAYFDYIFLPAGDIFSWLFCLTFDGCCLSRGLCGLIGARDWCLCSGGCSWVTSHWWTKPHQMVCLCSCLAGCFVWEVQHWSLQAVGWCQVLVLRWMSSTEYMLINILCRESFGSLVSWTWCSHPGGPGLASHRALGPTNHKVWPEKKEGKERHKIEKKANGQKIFKTNNKMRTNSNNNNITHTYTKKKENRYTKSKANENKTKLTEANKKSR